MSGSFLKVITRGVQALAFYKSKDILNFESLEYDSVVFPKDIALRAIAEKRGETSLEFMNVWCNGYKFSWTRQRTSVARLGLYGNYINDEKTDIAHFKLVPVDLSFSVWWWSRDFDKLLQVMERFMFWQHRNPNLELKINDVYPVEFDMLFRGVSDESRIEELFDKGPLFVIRGDIDVEAWLFESFSLKTVLKIILNVYDNTFTPPELIYTETFEL